MAKGSNQQEAAIGHLSVSLCYDAKHGAGLNTYSESSKWFDWAVGQRSFLVVENNLQGCGNGLLNSPDLFCRVA